MAKMKSTLTNMVMVLVGFALIIAALLAWTNQLTAGPIQAKARQTLANGIKTVMGSHSLEVTATDTLQLAIDGKQSEFIVHHTADQYGKPIGAAVECCEMGFAGDLKILVGFALDGTILGYTILQHAETPGLGAKADAWFQKEGKGCIVGKNPSQDNLAVSKDGGEVDAITASTITSRAFLKAINRAYAAYVSQNKQNAEPAAAK